VHYNGPHKAEPEAEFFKISHDYIVLAEIFRMMEDDIPCEFFEWDEP
jgi:hypothetical protein